MKQPGVPSILGPLYQHSTSKHKMLKFFEARSQRCTTWPSGVLARRPRQKMQRLQLVRPKLKKPLDPKLAISLAKRAMTSCTSQLQLRLSLQTSAEPPLQTKSSPSSRNIVRVSSSSNMPTKMTEKVSPSFVQTNSLLISAAQLDQM